MAASLTTGIQEHCDPLSPLTAAVAFEKLTDMDYRGNTYYTIRNLTLYECQGWCREEPECQAAKFRSVRLPRSGCPDAVQMPGLVLGEAAV